MISQQYVAALQFLDALRHARDGSRQQHVQPVPLKVSSEATRKLNKKKKAKRKKKRQDVRPLPRIVSASMLYQYALLTPAWLAFMVISLLQAKQAAAADNPAQAACAPAAAQDELMLSDNEERQGEYNSLLCVVWAQSSSVTSLKTCIHVLKDLSDTLKLTVLEWYHICRMAVQIWH